MSMKDIGGDNFFCQRAVVISMKRRRVGGGGGSLILREGDLRKRGIAQKTWRKKGSVLGGEAGASEAGEGGTGLFKKGGPRVE